MTKTLKTVVNSLDDVEDSLHGFYVEYEGHFILDVDDITEHPLVGTLKRAYDRVVAEGKELEHQRASLAARISSDPSVLVSEWNAEIEKKNREIERKQAFIERKTGDIELDRALRSIGVKPELMPAAFALHRDDVEVREIRDGVFQVSARTKFGEIPIARSVQRWANSREAAAFLCPNRIPRFGAQISPNAHPARGATFADLVRALK